MGPLFKASSPLIHNKMLQIVIIALLASSIPPSVATGPSRSGCQRSCGDLTIPYPFGIQHQDGCYSDDGGSSFTVSCDQFNGHQSMFMFNMSYYLEILDISIEKHEIRLLMFVASNCYSASGEAPQSLQTRLILPKFPISSTKNSFVAVGCDTLGIFRGIIDGAYATGCVSFCQNISDATNGSCLGTGCCETNKIPKNATNFEITIGSFYNHSLVRDNPCSYAFMVETDYFNFSTQYLYNMTDKRMPMILDWSVGNQTCHEARRNMTSYMCTENTNCSDADNGSGYHCHCVEGYQGNPYLPNGCQDIDECETIRPCNTTCMNFPGTYNCSCPSGYIGDGRNDGSGCSPNRRGKKFTFRDAALGAGIGLLVLVLCLSWTYWGFRQRSAMEERKRFFKENGGLMLQQLLFKNGSSVETLKVFSEEELKKATNNYDERRILGQGGQGTVYKGFLPNDKVVAIKKAKMLDRSQVKEFINEVIVLSQINHKNVVKLVGCCLETEYPLLVYEFVGNGTLFNHIHNSSSNSTLSWIHRLHIAAETAGALSYLHYDTAVQIVHRDIKSTNILIDENYIAKIADFGASRLVPIDQTQINTLVQGTFGYLDPEYLHTSQLTEKSDVYSFGVVLAELLTGLKALSFLRPEKDRNLSSYFASAMEEDRLFDIVNKGILNERTTKEIKEVGVLANRCLKVRGEDRPTMKEVAMELEGFIRAITRRSWTREDIDLEEKEDLLYRDATSINTSYIDSIGRQAPFELDEGR